MFAEFTSLSLYCHESHNLTLKVARIGKVEKTLEKVKSIP